MSTIRVRISPFLLLYVVFVLVLLVGWPILVALAIQPPTTGWLLAVACSGLLGALLTHIAHICGGSLGRYWHGLLTLASSLSTGWVYLSFMTVVPGLACAIALSAYFSLRADLGVANSEAQQQFQKLVLTFHGWRLRK
jgi:hypothetical protein